MLAVGFALDYYYWLFVVAYFVILDRHYIDYC